MWNKLKMVMTMMTVMELLQVNYEGLAFMSMSLMVSSFDEDAYTMGVPWWGNKGSRIGDNGSSFLFSLLCPLGILPLLLFLLILVSLALCIGMPCMTLALDCSNWTKTVWNEILNDKPYIKLGKMEEYVIILLIMRWMKICDIWTRNRNLTC